MSDYESMSFKSQNSDFELHAEKVLISTHYDNRLTRLQAEIATQVAPDDWRQKAACLGLYSIMFDHENETRQQKTEREQAAKRICSSCVVIKQCREAAMSGDWKGVVIANMTETELNHAKSQASTNKPKAG